MLLKFCRCCIELKDAPKAEREVCFIGRSNVGKSSVINAIADENISFVSKKPGKTATAVFFSTKNATSFFVDLPGYGFAKRGSETREIWSKNMHTFLERESMKRVYLLIDAVVGVTQLDINCAEFLLQKGKLLDVVINKIDKTNKERVLQVVQEVEILQPNNVYTISTKKRSFGNLFALKKDVEALLLGKMNKKIMDNNSQSIKHNDA